MLVNALRGHLAKFDWAIVRTLAPHACRNRRTSRTFRIDNFSPSIVSPTRQGSHATDHWIVDDVLVAPRGCPASIGITVRLASKSVSAFRWNHCPTSLEFAECMLVLIGATPEGKKELLGFQVGVRESAQSWRELLVDLKTRGLAIAPELATGDGALGFWKALDEVSPTT